MNCSHSLIDERNFFLWLWSESYDKNFSRNAGNVFTLVILRRFESLESRSEMDNYIFYHEYSFDDFHSLTPLNWPPLPTANELEPFSFLKHNNKDKFRVCCGQFWSFISFSVPNNNFFPSPTKKNAKIEKKSTRMIAHNRLTETARLLVRTNVRRVFGTGGTSRSHSAEKREMELKRKYWNKRNLPSIPLNIMKSLCTENCHQFFLLQHQSWSMWLTKKQSLRITNLVVFLLIWLVCK